MSFHSLVKSAERFVTSNSPAILTSIGVAGTVGTAVLAFKAGMKAERIIDDYKQEIKEGQRANLIPDFTRKEQFLATWPLLVPPVVTGSITVGAIVFANKIGSRRAAAMAAAYTISQEALSEYKDKVVERLGETKERKIRDEIAQDRVNDAQMPPQLILSNSDKQLFMESYTKRYFLCDVETIRKAENDINRRIRNEMSASLSDFYDLIGLEHTDISDDVGWNLDQDMEVEMTAVIAQNNKPCIVITYPFQPVRRFHKLV